MTISSRTPEGTPNRCPVCGKSICIEPSIPPGDAPCPNCGSLLWFAEAVLGDDVDMLVHDAIEPDLLATNKADAIREMIAKLSSVGAIERENEDDIIRAILKREDLGSTGIGRGFAVPHAKHTSVDRLIGAMAISREGIEFNSLDNRRVHIVFLFVSPMDQPGDHLNAIERISRNLQTRY